MNIFFYNRDNGCGVESSGNIFIEILKRVKEVDNILEFKGQNADLSSIDESKFDLIILNDISHNEEFKLKLDEVDLPKINLMFSFDQALESKIDLYLNYNVEYSKSTYGYHINQKKHKKLDLISGNLWENYKPWDDRSDDILYVARLHRNKIVPGFIDYVRKQNKKIKFYGVMIDEEYYEENKDVIDYKGFVDRKKLIQIYNDHKYLWLFSTTECLSITIREALLCGTYPIVLDHNNYTMNLTGDIYTLSEKNKIPKKIENVYSNINYKVHNHPTVKQYYKEKFSFNRMVATFLLELEELLGKSLTFNNKFDTIIKSESFSHDRMIYTVNDVIDWEKVEV